MSSSRSKRKVAIVGAINYKTSDAPFNSPSWEIWTIGKLAGKLPRITRLYEVHPPEAYVNYERAMRDSGAAIYLADDLLIEEWGRHYGNLKNSVSLMLCHALHEGVDTVAVYNAPQSRDPSNDQKVSVVYWLGVLAGAGVEIEDHSNLIRWDGVYGLRAGSRTDG